ncbi:SH3 domain-containing protein 19 isoform X3 [Hippopotamus amphibius kiboko]|uniref:SH3 domain-containing protein 19 isoform X3 n=1 Tax=Hippopotamus amphibius kiboko TaxID=575201 RepID=UPI0025935148|nr:SH3 domain-containing protein 19 isoform X3 [Hippopotamus amphibius kiboko]
MAEGRRREDEDEELRERRELGGPRRARGRALSGHSAADRSERNKPEHRSSSQGPLSSIRAAIKRSSRSSIQSELHRDRRRPEITIVAAEPLRPTSWFPGAPPPGLAFSPSSAAGPWRPRELVPAELPPSYEQVIKEINQVQVNTTNNNNAAATPRQTITSATQTDFCSEEIDSHLPQTLQAPLKPLQPPRAPSASDPLTSEAPLIVFDISEEQNCPENSSAARCPVPKPRSKSNLRPVARNPHTKEQNHQKSSPAAAPEEAAPSRPQPPWDDTSPSDRQAVMNAERSPNTVVSRIKALEGQTNTESLGLPKKPEIAPRTVPPRPAVSSGKPSVAPKPAANRASGEWDSWTANRLRGASREGLAPHSPRQEAGSIPVTKPELPKKPNPGLTRSANPESLGGGPAAESPDSGKKAPTPAPRPLLPKKSVSAETPPSPAALLKPVTVPPRLSVASQAKAFRSLGEGPPASPPVPVLQSKPPGDIDLISFDDDVLPAPSGKLVEDSVDSEVVLDPFQLPTRTEATKERAVQPAPTRKPTVIRIPAKPGKCLHEEDPQSPPPLPIEKPIGNTFSTVPGKLGNADRTRNLLSVPHGIANEDIIPQNPGELSCKRGDVLVILKQAEGNYLECQKGADTGRVHLSHVKIIAPLDEHLRSRPNDPSHAQKPVDSGAPHAVVLHDFPAEQADDLNLTSGEIVYLLEKIDTDWYRGKCRNQTGVFPASYVRVIIDVPGGSGKRKSVASHCVKGPRCVARFEYIGDQKDELSFSEGEIIILKEYVNDEWARGELRDRSGIFPLNFVELIEDHPTSGTNVLSAKVPPKAKKDSGADSQENSLSGEWCEALHSFTAETSDDLSFRRGDRILILEHVDSDWYKGRLRGREGIFPAVFVRPCPAEAKSMATSALKGRKAKALYDFHGENEDELSFKAGDIITELESVDDDWMSGELMGKSGIFPKTYIQFLQVS